MKRHQTGRVPASYPYEPHLWPDYLVVQRSLNLARARGLNMETVLDEAFVQFWLWRNISPRLQRSKCRRIRQVLEDVFWSGTGV